MGHYFRKTDQLKDGDLVLMDYAPDYRYYTSDVTRMWPVKGKFTKDQASYAISFWHIEMHSLTYIRPGATSDEILDFAARDMAVYLRLKPISKPEHMKAAQDGLKFRGHFQHPVGMAVHDVGRVRGVKLLPGMVLQSIR